MSLLDTLWEVLVSFAQSFVNSFIVDWLFGLVGLN